MEKKKILFLMHMPPPVHGAAVMGQAVHDSEDLREEFECRYVNYSISRSLNEINRFSLKKTIVVARLLLRVFVTVLRFRPDIVYMTPSFRPLGFRKDRLVVRFLKRRGCRVVFHLHNKGVSTLSGRPGYDRRFRSFFRDTEVILLSERLFGDIAPYVDRKAVHICPNGIDPVLDGTPEREDDGIPRLLSLSNVLDGRGTTELLDACVILDRHGIPFRCRFAGCLTTAFRSGDYAELASERGLEGKVCFDGTLYGDAKADAYREADIFVHTTREDCFPLVILEAMSASLPVVASLEGGIPDEVTDGETGWLFPKGDVEALASRLEFLLTHPAARREMGAAGRTRYEQSFTGACFEDRLLHILKEIAL